MIVGIGTDIVDIDRIGKLDLDKLIQRILTPSEQELLPPLPKQRLQRVAGRFAAKEAIVKALKVGIGSLCGFLDIEVLNDEAGAPYVVLSTRVLEKINRGELKVHLSISHTETYAVATAIFESIMGTC